MGSHIHLREIRMKASLTLSAFLLAAVMLMAQAKPWYQGDGWLTVPLVSAPRQQRSPPSSEAQTSACTSTMDSLLSVLKGRNVILLRLMLQVETHADQLTRRGGSKEEIPNFHMFFERKVDNIKK